MNYPNESQQKQWLDAHAQQVLTDIGITARQVVLDFGCGSGIYTIPAAQLVGAEGIVYALDEDAQALEEANRKATQQGLENINIILQSEEDKIQLPDSSCDVMLLYDVLHLIDNWPLMFQEAYRTLKYSGLLSVYPMHIDKEKMKRYLEKAGFTSTGEIHALFNFVKRGIE